MYTLDNMTLEELITYRNLINEKIKALHEEQKIQFTNELDALLNKIEEFGLEVWYGDCTISAGECELAER